MEGAQDDMVDKALTFSECMATVIYRSQRLMVIRLYYFQGGGGDQTLLFT